MGTFYHFVWEQHLLATIEEALEKCSMMVNLSHFETVQVPPLLMTLCDIRKLYLNNKLAVLPNDMTLLHNLTLSHLTTMDLPCCHHLLEPSGH
jgi:hypothetical protein